jgi:5'-3' exonuclease
MKLHVIDGTYELFRAFFGAPKERDEKGREVGAIRSLARSLKAMRQDPTVTYVGVAFDHVIESFRNDLYPGYKTGDGIDPELLAQFPWAEEVTRELGMTVWPMVEFEADDALATAAARFAEDPRVDEVRICSPDKDLAQCVRDPKVKLWDRRAGTGLDEAGVNAKFGVPPALIPDYLALVGDSADGYPGIAKWGPKSAATLLSRYGSIEAIPDDPKRWDVKVRGAEALAESLVPRRDEALLYRKLATLRTDVPLTQSLDDLVWS